jgi:hypothetical protein
MSRSETVVLTSSWPADKFESGTEAPESSTSSATWFQGKCSNWLPAWTTYSLVFLFVLFPNRNEAAFHVLMLRGSDEQVDITYIAVEMNSAFNFGLWSSKGSEH